MPDIKPLETFYKGYRFRSRLEARWAVFFDAAGIQYGYEPQGYKLSDGTCYLPDFFLPEFKAYVEIKPTGISGPELQTAQRKCESLFYGIDNVIVLLCIGDPSEDNIGLFCSDSTDSGGGENWWSAKFYRDKRPMIGIEDSREDREYFTSGWGQTWSVEQLKAYHSRNNLMAEKNKARQARFEHGEHGA